MAKRKSRKKATRRRSSKSDLGLGTALAGTAGVITGLAGVNYLRTKQAPTSQEISNMISGITGKLGRTEIIIPMGLGLLMSAKKINVPMINKSTAAVLGTGIFLGTAALAATTPQSPGFNPLTGQIGTQSRFRNMRAAPADSNNLMRRR